MKAQGPFDVVDIAIRQIAQIPNQPPLIHGPDLVAFDLGILEKTCGFSWKFGFNKINLVPLICDRKNGHSIQILITAIIGDHNSRAGLLDLCPKAGSRRVNQTSPRRMTGVFILPTHPEG